MKGKERDKQLAEGLRNEFIKRYESQKAFKELLDEMEDNCLDKMIHSLKQEAKINIFRDYNALKQIASDVKENHTKEVYDEVCAMDEARTWINDNGKYKTLAFDALCNVYKRQDALKPLIEL
nr:hypothetical protein [uncultured Cellulosilyticum sp.]